MGDREAFELIVTKYQSQLLHFTWSILRDRDEAKDVTQDSFVRSYLNLHKYDPKKSFKTWLFTIAYNRSMDAIRQNRARSRLIDGFTKENPTQGPRENPERRLENSQEFHSIMRKLNRKERTALSLKLNEGYLAREIAEIMGCKESTIRVHIMNAKKKLKKILEKKKHV